MRSSSGTLNSSGHSVQRIFRALIRKFERVFAITVIFLASGAVLKGLLRAEGAAEDSVWIYFVWGTVYITTAALAFVRRREVRETLRVLKREPLLLSLIIYTCLSFLWAADPLLTGRRVIIFGATTFVGVYLASRFSLYQLFRLSGIALGLAGFISLITVVLFPEIGLWEDGRGVGIKGVFGNKNILGRALSLGATISFFWALDKWSENRRFWIGTFCLLAILVFFSESQTSIVALTVVVLLVPLLRLLRSPGKLLIPSLILIGVTMLVVGLLVYSNWGSLLALLGRDETLSSRLSIWYATVVMILDEPWLGYGYGADWLNEVSSFGYLFIQYFSEWEPGHAHSGILQVGFELGAVGLFLVVGHLVQFASKSIRWIRLQSRSYAAYLPMAFLITLLGANTTQYTILSRNGVYWILYLAIALTLSQSIRRERS